MALTNTNIDVQIAIGSGLPAAGDIRKGGIVLSLNGAGTELVGIGTSTDGTDIVLLPTGGSDATTLSGKTLAQVITDAVAATRADIIDGADAALDTWVELVDSIKGNDTDIAALVTSNGTKVDKVVGKSLILDTEITRLASVENTTVVDNLASTSSTSALSAKQGKELKAQIDAISIPTVQTY